MPAVAKRCWKISSIGICEATSNERNHGRLRQNRGLILTLRNAVTTGRVAEVARLRFFPFRPEVLRLRLLLSTHNIMTKAQNRPSPAATASDPPASGRVTETRNIKTCASGLYSKRSRPPES